MNINVIFLQISGFVGFSWPGSHRNVNRLLPDEALQTDCSRGHRLDQNLPAWLSDWAAADLYSGVSEAMVRGSGEKKMPNSPCPHKISHKCPL